VIDLSVFCRIDSQRGEEFLEPHWEDGVADKKKVATVAACAGR
jgi:hypothetical protein